jgi:hypothetical protein
LKNSDYEGTKHPVQQLLRALDQTFKFVSDNRKLIQFVYSESKSLDRKHFKAVLEMDKQSVINFWQRLLEEVKRDKSIKFDLNFGASLIASLNVFLALQGWTFKGMLFKQEKVYIIDFVLKGLSANR